MGKKTKERLWVVLYKESTIQTHAKTEGAARHKVFRFLVSQGLIEGHQRTLFESLCEVTLAKVIT